MSANRSLSCAFALALAFAAHVAAHVAAAAPAACRLVALGPEQLPFAVNRHGVVVGLSLETDRADVSEDGTWTLLKDHGGGSVAEGVNRQEVIVGVDGFYAAAWHRVADTRFNSQSRPVAVVHRSLLWSTWKVCGRRRLMPSITA